eukprot:contig_17856_g4376
MLLLTGPGGEFTSALWRAMAERFNIWLATTATQAHISNEVVERHNLTVTTMVTRMWREHPTAEPQELLDLACLSMNSMVQHSGATPYQLVNGSTPRVPTALTSDVSALADSRVAGDDALRTHLQLLHADRAAHTEAEASVSLRRALARNAANVPHRDWASGDVVYYWTEGIRPSQGGWHGPPHVTDASVAKRSVRLQHGHTWTNRDVSEIRSAGPPSSPAPIETPAEPTPPPQAWVPSGTVWQLWKCAYGLSDEPRRWYESMLALMRSLKLRRSTMDHGFFTAHQEGQLMLVVAVHVDEFLIGGTTADVARSDGALRAALAAGPTKSGDLTFTCQRVQTSLEDDTGRITVQVDQ